MTETRFAGLEAQLADVHLRLAQLEGRRAPAPVLTRPAPPPPPLPIVPAPEAEPARPRVDWEDLFAGRALAWIGGGATLLGIVLLLVMAAARGWIDEETRVLMATAGSLGLFLAGGRLYERRGRTDAAAAMTAVGVLGLDAALVTAASAYELIAPIPALALALGMAAVATALCLRWQAQAVARATMLGALAAPLAVGAAGDPRTLVFLGVAYAAVAAVCVRRDWGGLGLAAFGIVTPQWAGVLALDEGSVSTSATLAALIVFSLLGIAVAAGLELRDGRARLRHSAAFLLALNAIAGAGAGYVILGGDGLANAWLVAVALVHLAAGLASRSGRVGRIGAELRLTSLTLGVLIADIAAAAVLDGAWLVGAWVASTVLFAVLNRRSGERQSLVGHGLSLHTSLAVGHVLMLDARESDAGGILLLALVAAACLVSGHINRAQWRFALQGLGLGLFAYATALTLDGTALAVAFAVEAVVLAGLARSDDAPAAATAALGFLGLALAQALIITDAPLALLDGLDHALAGAAALGAVALAAGVLAHRLPRRLDGVPLQGFLFAVAALTALYLASVELVSPFQGDGSDGVLSVRQQGQVLLSGFWALAGVAALVAGLRRDARPWRIAALALLGLAAGKVVLYDLSALTDIYRVISCIALGLLLLAGAFAWQRLRPRDLDDLRTMPAALR
ncbi:MAG: DUF2339 domain-containing protein [Solirubrobacteraceae bacterium]